MIICNIPKIFITAVFIDEHDVVVKNEERYEPFQDESGELDALFDEPQEIIVNEDVTIVMTNNVFPMPVKTTTDDLQKRSTDWFSGNLPFNDTVNTE